MENTTIETTGAYTLAEHAEFRKKLNAGEITAEQLKATYLRYVESNEALKAELNKRTLKELAPNGTQGRKKGEIIKRIVDDLAGWFYLGKSFIWSHGQDLKEVEKKLVFSVTDEEIQAFAAERSERINARKKALTNPETLGEFRVFIENTEGGVSALSTDQLSRYDELISTGIIERREREKEQKALIRRVEGLDEVEITITESWHDKAKCPVWVVSLSEWVERDIFENMLEAAKALGGYYYSWNGLSGFYFKNDKAAAEKLAYSKEGDVSTIDKIKEFQKLMQENVVFRFRHMADRLQESADETLSADRKVNTHRRARMAENAEAKARAELRRAATLHNISDKWESDGLKWLSCVWAQTHIDTFDTLIRDAMFRTDLANGIRYEQTRNRTATAEDVRAVIYPYPVIQVSLLKSICTKVAQRDGLKLVSARILKRVSATAESTIKVTSWKMIEDVQELLGKLRWMKLADNWEIQSLSNSLTHYKRMQAMKIENINHLRTVLREYLGCRAEPLKANPIKAAERSLIGKSIPGYFPTPPTLAEMVIDAADILPGMSVLEPSAGKGSLADEVTEAVEGVTVQCIEINPDLREILTMKGYTLIHHDFTTYEGQAVDRIVMNPPFENGQDIEHVMLAFEKFLKPGGKLVSIMCEGPFFRSDKKSEAFREWLNNIPGASWDKLPEGSFIDSDRSTAVNTRIVILPK
jgi:hypothetical protein